MRRLAIILAVTFVVFAAPADAGRLPRTWLWSPVGVPAKYQEFLGASRMPTPRGTIEVAIGFCPDFAPGTVGGCAYETQIWLLPNLRPGEDEYVFYHELGHIADYWHLAENERALFTRLVKLDGLPWWGREPYTATAPVPAETFAEAYSDCASQGYYVIPSPDPPAVHGFPVTPRSICRTIRRMVLS